MPFDEYGFDRQDFSGLGIDAEVAGLIYADLAPGQPDRFANAGIWGGLIIEQAMVIGNASDMGGVNREDFTEYLFGSLESAPTESDGTQAVVRELVWSLGFDQIADQVNDGNTPGARAPLTWILPTERIEKFIAGYLEGTDLQHQQQELAAHYRDEGHTMSASEIDAYLTKYDALEDRRHAARAAQKERQRYSTDTYEYASSQTDMHAVLKLDFLRQIEPILEDSEADPSLHARYGAKAANLLQLNGVIDKMREAGIDIADWFSIPRFMTVGVESYDAWTRGEAITEHVAAISQWIQQNPNSQYVIRSSAVHSEDGEHTGAGVYESVLVTDPRDSEAILQAMQAVYGSTNSEKALAYRQSIGVEHEQMGLVVQELAGNNSGWGNFGTINTVMAGVPQLMDYTLQQGHHPLGVDELGYGFSHPLPLSRSGALREFGIFGEINSPSGDRFHIPPDIKIHNPTQSWLAVQAAALAEKVAGRPVQVEFSFDPTSNHIYILQSRPLPERLLEPKPFGGFPEDKKPTFVGKSVGIVDGVEAIVNDDIYGLKRNFELHEQEYPDTSIIFVVNNSYGLGTMAGRLTNAIMGLSEEQRTKIIVVMSERPTASDLTGYGHLETLFSELGVTLLCPGSGSGRAPRDGETVTVYSNGFEGRIYGEEEPLW